METQGRSLAASLYRSSQLHFLQNNPLLARSDLRTALDYAKKSTDPSLKGAVFSEAALALALVEIDLAAATHAQQLFDQAENYARESTRNDEFALRHSASCCCRLLREMVTAGCGFPGPGSFGEPACCNVTIPCASTGKAL
jgi:hypothetical protein